MILFQFPAISHVHCVFLGRNWRPENEYAGNFSFQVDDKAENIANVRKNILASFSPSGLTCWTECRQIHGNTLLLDPCPTPIMAKPASLEEADGMMTSQTGHALIIKTADCQPILLTEKNGFHIMALHVGWRGNRNDFIKKAINEFCASYHLLPENIFAVRGPSLGPCHARFTDFEREWGQDFKRWFNQDSSCMNLWALAHWQLQTAGVPEDHIFDLDICTFCNFRNFFSYRRQRQTGRQAALIWIEHPA